uniref:Uncharacterized protein n=1 Tax=Tanacetum cinerariifolium TaxID=118510 RepID=A0A6L2JTP9_TANCI|nr:hypothetical protein [Tanacetum cinerariifolium]
MDISIISVSSDSSEDSTDTTVIPTEKPIIAPTIPPSPDYTLASFDYSLASETKSDPSENPSSGHIPPLPAVSPFLSSDDDTIGSDTPDTPPSPTHGTPFTEITASTQRSPVIPHHRVMILAPGQPIPHGRPYRYHLNGPVHMMTTKKRVGPLPIQRLVVRYSVDHSSSDSSSRHSLALSSVRADLIPSPKRVRDIGYLADVEVGPREPTVERVVHPAMAEDIPEPAQEGAVEVTLLRASRGSRDIGLLELTKRVAELERDNRRLRGTVSVKSQRVDRLQRSMSRAYQVFEVSLGQEKSIAAIWLEKVVTPLIVTIIKVEFLRISLTRFRSCISRSQTRASQSRQTRTLELFLDFTVCEGSSTLEDCVQVRFIDGSRWL